MTKKTPEPARDGMSDSFNFADAFLESSHRTFAGCQDKEPHELTADEQAAIAVLAGVAGELVPDGTNALRWQTKNPCGIAKIHGKWRVYVQSPHHQ